MSITVKTDNGLVDVTPKKESNDQLLTALLLQDFAKSLTNSKKQAEETTGLSTATTSTSSTVSSVEETTEVEMSAEEATVMSYSEAMIAAMAAMSKTLSDMIDKSSGRALLLNEIAQTVIEQGEKNLLDTIKDLKEARKAEKKAEKWGTIGTWMARAAAIVSIAIGAVMCCIPGMQIAGAIMITIGAALLAMDETGTTEKAIQGIADGIMWIDAQCGNNMSEEAEKIFATVLYMFVVMLVSIAAPMYLPAALARGASAAANGAATATSGAAKVAAESAKAIAEGAKTYAQTTKTILAGLTEAVEGASNAAKGTMQAVNTTRDIAIKASTMAKLSTTPAAQASVLTQAANVANAAADTAETAAQSTTTAVKIAMDAAKTLEKAAITLTKTIDAGADATIATANFVDAMTDAVDAANKAAYFAKVASGAAEAAENAAMIAYLAMQGGSALAAATNMTKGAGNTTKTTVDLAFEYVAQSSSLRTLFNILSKGMGHRNAAMTIYKISQTCTIEYMTMLTVALSIGEAVCSATAGVYQVYAGQARDNMGKTEKEKLMIQSTQDAIEAQRSRESEYLALMQKSVSDSIGALKPLLAKQWRPTTNLQG